MKRALPLLVILFAATAHATPIQADLQIAQVALAKHHYAEAIAAAGRAPAQDPAVQNVLAYAYAGLRQYQQAFAAADQQVALAPNDPNALDTQGEIRIMAGQFDDAERSFRYALRLDPKFFLAWQGIAVAQFFRGDFENGFESLRDAQRLDPTVEDKLDWNEDLALMMGARGDLDGSVAMTEQVLRDPLAARSRHGGVALAQRAMTYYWAGKYTLAERDIMAALERSAGLKDARLARDQRVWQALILIKLGGRLDEAEQLLKVIEEDARGFPDSPEVQSDAHWARGAVLVARDDVKGGIAELERCDPDVVGCRYALSQALEASGDRDGARRIDAEILGQYSRYLVRVVVQLEVKAARTPRFQ